MALKNPVAIYTAETNLEGHLLKLCLVEAGIEAFASEDVSTVGLWMGGTMPELHRPQVWVDRSQVDQARPVLEQYELDKAERRLGKPDVANNDSPIQVICEDCGKSSLFPASQQGSVQDCPHCSAYVDVGEVDDDDAPWDDAGEEEAE